MTRQVIILPRAEADIEASARWWAENHSVAQAARWFDAVHEQLEKLADFPERHGLSPENDEFPYEVRDKPLGTSPRPGYRAVFSIRGDAVYVLTVRRAAQDILRPGEVDAPPAT
jgi:plasmid stabilization system protein ParE